MPWKSAFCLSEAPSWSRSSAPLPGKSCAKLRCVNARLVSSLVAESPFVKAREADQQFYRRHFGSLLWKVIRLAWEAGRFARLGVSWETLEALVDLKIDAPAVASRDALRLAQTHEAQVNLGILSRRTAAAQAGLDYDAEVAHGAGAKPQASDDDNP